MSVVLTKEIKSVVKPSVIYGKKGEEVKLIAESGEVLIVEGMFGKFPVNVKHTSNGGGKNIQGKGSRRCDTNIADMPECIREKSKEAKPVYVADKIDVQAKQKNKTGIVQATLFG